MGGGLLEDRSGGRCTSRQARIAEKGGSGALSDFARWMMGSTGK